MLGMIFSKKIHIRLRVLDFILIIVNAKVFRRSVIYQGCNFSAELLQGRTPVVIMEAACWLAGRNKTGPAHYFLLNIFKFLVRQVKTQKKGFGTL